MIPLIQGISNSDAERYYNGTVVFTNNNGKIEAFIFSSKEGGTAYVQNQSGETVRRDYSSLLRKTIPPFYTLKGMYLGLTVQRSTRRGMSYNYRDLPDLLSVAQTGEPLPDPNGKRLSKDFYKSTVRGITVLMYRGLYVGFYNKAETKLVVLDSQIEERFLKQVKGISDEFVVEHLT